MMLDQTGIFLEICTSMYCQKKTREWLNEDIQQVLDQEQHILDLDPNPTNSLFWAPCNVFDLWLRWERDQVGI